jgi:hypothetical protein
LRLQDVLHNNSNRQELLLSVWRAFLSLAEHAMKVIALSATARQLGYGHEAVQTYQMHQQ